MKFKSNENLGLLLMVLAVVLAVAAWIISASLGITAFALFFIGAHLFYTERTQRRARPPLKKGPATSASPVPAASATAPTTSTTSGNDPTF